MQIIGFIAIGLGILIGLIGWIWLIIKGFQEGGVLWGILNIILQPITGLIFCLKYKTGWLQLALLILGNVIAVGVMMYLFPDFMKMFTDVVK